MRVAVAIELTDEERAKLIKYSRGHSTPVRLMKRAWVVLLAADGKTNAEIAVEVGMARGPVGTWRKWFAKDRLAGIEKGVHHGSRIRVSKASPPIRSVRSRSTRSKPSRS